MATFGMVHLHWTVKESVKKCGALALSSHWEGFSWQGPKAGVLLPKTIFPPLIEDLGSGLYKQMRSFLGPLHLSLSH